MKDELQTKLLEYLNGADAFLKEQIPDYINQLLVFEQWSLHYWFVVEVSLIFVGMFCLFYAYLYRGYKYDRNVPFTVIGVFIISIAGLCALINYNCTKKLELAPKVYIMKMVTKGCGC